jgi:hypothetical protein
MATVTGKPYPGPFIINLENVRDRLIDLPDGATRGLRSEQEGLPRALETLARSVPAHGEAAGVSLRVHSRIVENTATIDILAQHERELDKAREVVRETRKKLEHDREHDIGLIVDVVESTAQRTGGHGPARGVRGGDPLQEPDRRESGANAAEERGRAGRAGGSGRRRQRLSTSGGQKGRFACAAMSAATTCTVARTGRRSWSVNADANERAGRWGGSKAERGIHTILPRRDG